MAASSGPDVIDAGLVLALDAADRNSFDSNENLALNSEAINSWANNGGAISVSANSQIAPNGTLTADVLSQTAVTGASRWVSSMTRTYTAGVTYTLSIWLKKISGTDAQPSINLWVNGGTNQSVGTITTEWVRYSKSFTPVSTISSNTYTGLNAGWSDTGVANNFTFAAWGFQVETGSSASPYYPTTSTAKIRGTTLIDLTGRGNTGTLTNGPTYSSANGGSIIFDGVDDYGVINDNSVIKPVNQITVSTFIYPTLTSYSNCRIFGDWHQESGLDRWILYANGSSISWYMRTQTTGEGGTTGWTIINNQWVSLTGVYDGTNQDLYVNGNFFSRRPCSGTMNSGNGSTPIRFGRQETTGGGFQGRIAQTQIYNRALTAAEIQQNFNATRSRFGI
jgi:hypothetical protein